MPSMVKTERLTLLTTPEFKALLAAEAASAGVSVAELVRRRCQPEAGEDEALLAASARELHRALGEARKSLGSGLKEADAAISELRLRRISRASRL